jgi:flagellar biosynthetic protein FliR
MPLSLTGSDINTLVASAIFPFFRISALLFSMPLLGGPLLPVTVRLMVAIGLTVMIVPFIAPIEISEFIGFTTLLMIFKEILLGVAMGLILQVLFQVFTIAGNIISMQCGLGFASLVDPSSDAAVPILSQFYALFINLLFLTLNGHLVVMNLIIDSFSSLPVTDTVLIHNDLASVLTFSGTLFNDAVLVALPAIISLLIVNFALAVITKASPQLNIFTIGFPITLIIGLLLVYMSIAPVFWHFDTISQNAYGAIRELSTR